MIKVAQAAGAPLALLLHTDHHHHQQQEQEQEQSLSCITPGLTSTTRS
jgi:hypothetical protein